MSNFVMETTTKQDVVVALKNTAKGQLSYELGWSDGFDSLHVSIAA